MLIQADGPHCICPLPAAMGGYIEGCCCCGSPIIAAAAATVVAAKGSRNAFDINTSVHSFHLSCVIGPPNCLRKLMVRTCHNYPRPISLSLSLSHILSLSRFHIPRPAVLPLSSGWCLPLVVLARIVSILLYLPPFACLFLLYSTQIAFCNLWPQCFFLSGLFFFIFYFFETWYPVFQCLPYVPFALLAKLWALLPPSGVSFPISVRSLPER